MNTITMRRLVALLVAIALLSFAPTSPVAAHPGHGNEELPPGATNAMREFHANRQGAQNLAAAAGTPCVDGFAGQFPCSNIDLEAFLPLNQIGGTSAQSEANDIWGWTDPVTGAEIAIIGLVFGTSFVDVTNPTAPVYLGELPTHGAFGSSWRDIKVYNDHAFIVSEAKNHGMQVFDLTQLRTATPGSTFSETAHYNKVASAHNIVINEDSGFAYVVGAAGKNSCSGGLHMVDISNPTNASFAGCFSADGYTHDAQCVDYVGPDAAHAGKEICVASNEDTVTVVDVSDKNIPVQLSRTGYTGAEYTHQGWLTEDHRYFLLDDELDETNLGHSTRTRIWDMADLDAPVLIGTYDSTNAAIDHNQYIKGNLSYQSNYTSGLRILDISDIGNANLSEVAFFDVWPSDDAATFNGTWSNYPYFDSGIVVVSGIEQGLFVLRPQLGGGGDNPPSVTITDPVEGATVVGTSVTITATAGDDNGVTSVEFFINGNSIGVDTAAPYSVSWDSTTVPDGTVSVSATATDTIAQTSSDTSSVTVDNEPDPTLHVGDMDPSTTSSNGGKWNATVTFTVHDSGEAAVPNATVTGSWSNGTNGSGSCFTNAAGQCSITENNIRRNVSSVTFTVTGVSHPALAYDSGANHDPDGDSNGTVIVISAP